MGTKNISQSIFINLPLKEIQLKAMKFLPADKFSNDLKIARLLPNKRLKYEYFNMMVKKYGFLYWQLPAVQLGNFAELEVKIEFKKPLKLEAAIKRMKGMWKNHMWKFLQEYKKNSERREIKIRNNTKTS